MNGEESKYFDMKFDALVKLFDERMKVQDDRHKENRATLTAMASKMKCDVHAERMKGITVRQTWLYFVMTIVVIGGIVLKWVK